MDPITLAIIAAISAGVTGGVTSVGKEAIVDAYHGIKNFLKARFGNDSDVVQAIDKLETKPDSKGQRQVVEEEVLAVKAHEDPVILKAAQEMIELIKAAPGGEKHIQNAIGSYIAQADRGGTANVNVNRSNE